MTVFHGLYHDFTGEYAKIAKRGSLVTKLLLRGARGRKAEASTASVFPRWSLGTRLKKVGAGFPHLG